MIINTYIPGEDENIKIHGRTCKAVPLPLFWNGSMIEVNSDGSELYFEIETGFSTHEQWIRIAVNDFNMIRMPLQKGKNIVYAFRNMPNDGEIKNVKLIKEIQPMNVDSESFMTVTAVKTDGVLHKVKDRKYKLEFVGDSLTSGEGLSGPKGLQGFVPMIFTTQGNYAVQAADAVNAEYRILSQSGWGTYCSWDNNLEHTLPKHYTKICSVLKNDVNQKMGADRDYDFSEWKPDCVVINLGSNDFFAFRDDVSWTDKNGVVHKQRMNPDGTLNSDDTAKFRNAVYDFLCLVRKCNPDSYILWAYGMVGTQLKEFIEDAVNAFAKDTDDKRVSFILLPDLKDEYIGANNHPNLLHHTIAAKVLTEKLEKILNE